MKDYKKFILYFALGLVVLMLWTAWQRDYGLKNAIPANTTQTAQTTNKIPLPNTSQSIPVSSTQSNQSIPLGVSKTKQQTHNTANLITVGTPLMQVKIDLNGGSIVYASLNHYKNTIKDKQNFVLFNTDPDTYYIAQSGLTDANGKNHQAVNYKSAEKTYQFNPNQDTLTVSLTGVSHDGITIKRDFTFHRLTYDVNTKTSLENHSGHVWQGRYFMQTKRVSTQPAKAHSMISRTFFGIAVSSKENAYQKFKFSKLQETPLGKTIQGGWLAFIQHYFLTAWVPNASQSYYYYSQANQNLVTAGIISNPQTINNGATHDYRSQLYIGPEIASQLDKISPHLSLTIDYGWFWFISAILFKVLKWVNSFIGNWGWSIIITTLLIKLALFKLSETSYKSMAKMKALQPKIQALKERLGDDRQAMGRETMALYKKEKVNPLGGCLPIMVQIPVFIALYWVLIESGQLRQAPWIFWIHDLATKDPYYILPVIMAGTMFLQQRLSPPASDPTQQKVMMFLPLIFLFMFLNF